MIELFGYLDAHVFLEASDFLQVDASTDETVA
jgi:hypothetical protein